MGAVTVSDAIPMRLLSGMEWGIVGGATGRRGREAEFWGQPTPRLETGGGSPEGR
jgi:hypothetical protein